MKRLTLACLLVLAPVVATANIIPTGITQTGTGPFTWTYTVSLSADQNAVSGVAPTSNPVSHDDLSFGAFLTIYDFAGYVPGTCAGPAGWACTSQGIGFTPDDVSPSDDAALPNLTWVYTSGPTLVGSPNGIDLGQFSAQSIYGSSALVNYTARGFKNSGASIGTVADNVGTAY